MRKLKVGVLGATGMVGQRFIQYLNNHPYFEIAALAASEKSAGKKYREAAKWYLPESIPKDVSEMIVENMSSKIIEEYDLNLVFSAVPSDIAKTVEADFATYVPLFSNTSTYRMEEDVPLMIPEVNPEHFSLIKIQQKNRGWGGYIITNPNCTTVGFIVPLKPILDTLGIRWVNMTSMQACSGAGYDGVPSMAIIDNIIPHIKNEEEKCETEGLKILGRFEKNQVKYADFQIIASCNRVPVLDGHMIDVLIGTREDFDADKVKKILSKFEGLPQKMNLPTAPKPLIVVKDEDDRPQPRFDRDLGKRMAITVGRIARKRERVLRLACLSHNTVRGAAGASVLNAELAYKKKLL